MVQSSSWGGVTKDQAIVRTTAVVRLPDGYADHPQARLGGNEAGALFNDGRDKPGPNEQAAANYEYESTGKSTAPDESQAVGLRLLRP